MVAVRKLTPQMLRRQVAHLKHSLKCARPALEADRKAHNESSVRC
jgi:hypothetical protein